jgi:hypothetical protein
MILAEMAFLEAAMVVMINDWIDRITRTANASSQDTESENRAAMSNVNIENTASLTAAVGAVRTQLASVFQPAQSVCVATTLNRGLVTASVNNRAQLRAVETEFSNTFGNRPGTAGEKGNVSYLSERFRTRMQRYCNSTVGVVDLPAAAGTCAASIGADRDIFPYDSIFKPVNLNTASDYTAAKDVAYNLMGNVVVDPIRGAALARQEGQGMFVLRMSDQARLNLASGALLSMVERRRDHTGAGNSEISLNSNISFTTASVSALAQTNARGGPSQTLDTIATLMGQSARQLYAFRGFMEQWAAIKATSLAIDIGENKAGEASVSSRVMQRQ